MFQAVTVELPKPRCSKSLVSVTLGDKQHTKASGRGRYRNISWEVHADWYRKLQLSTLVHNLMDYLGKLQLVVSSRFYGGVVVLSRARAKRKLTETRSFLPYMITSPVCYDICLTTIFNSIILVTVTGCGADGMTVYNHVFEDKGCKITVKFNILDGPSTELERQRSQVNQAAKEAEKIESIRDRLGASVAYLEGLLRFGDLVKDVSRSL